MSVVTAGRARDFGSSETSAASLGWVRSVGLVVRLAARELRSGLSGFGILIACVALGVGVITAVGSLADAVLDGFQRQGRTLLGGDVSLTRVHKRAEPDELARLSAGTTVSEVAFLRSMARTPDGADQSLIELKGVDDFYPLVGTFKIKGDRTLPDALAASMAAVVAPSLLDQLQLRVGDAFKVGDAEFVVAGVIEDEPDKIANRMPFGPRVVVRLAALEQTGLVQPGSLIYWRYSLTGRDGAELAEGTVTEGDLSRWRSDGFIVRDRSSPSPEIERSLDRLRQFLVLLGLTALLVGGVGVANAVSAFIDKRRKVIATYKSVGASSHLVFLVMLTQITVVALIGIAFGLAAGLSVPAIISVLYGSILPIELTPTVGLASIGTGVAYGLLIALLFTIWPLGQAERITPASLFRNETGAGVVLPSRRVMAATGLVGALLVIFAVLASGTPRIALGFLGGAAIILGLFWLLGTGVTWAARRLPRPRRPEVALAMTGIGSPGGLTRSVIVSLGAGLSLLVAVALVDRSLLEELGGRLPENSPNYFAVDIARPDVEVFEKTVREIVPDARIDTAPMLRGRIVAIKGVPADKAIIDPEAAWVLNGDRGLSFSATLPQGSTLIDGAWWPDDYDGPPQVSFAADLAREMRLGIGDTVTVNVLGRNITAEIANLRRIEWESLAINFVMVFTPNTLAAAPYNTLATVTLPAEAGPQVEAAVGRALGRALPTVTVVSVKEAVAAFSGVFANIMTAVRAAALLTLLAGALVLAGALATAQRRRMLQSVILKCIGATRRKQLAAHALEYGVLAVVAALLSILLGGVAAWIVTTVVLKVAFTLSVTALLGAVGVALALILLLGGVGTWRVLEAKPIPFLRNL